MNDNLLTYILMVENFQNLANLSKLCVRTVLTTGIGFMQKKEKKIKRKEEFCLSPPATMWHYEKVRQLKNITELTLFATNFTLTSSVLVVGQFDGTQIKAPLIKKFLRTKAPRTKPLFVPFFRELTTLS